MTRSWESKRSETTRPMDVPSATAEAFLVRLWREPGSSGEEGEVRGSIRLLRNGELRHFSTLSALDGHLMATLAGETSDERSLLCIAPRTQDEEPASEVQALRAQKG